MDKLHKVLRVRRQQESQQAALMARSQAAANEAAAQHEDLLALMEEYRLKRDALAAGHPLKLRQFERFFAQLVSAVRAQRQVLDNLRGAEQRDTEAYLRAYRDRLALERLLERRELAHKTETLKRQRRAHIHRAPDTMV